MKKRVEYVHHISLPSGCSMNGISVVPSYSSKNGISPLIINCDSNKSERAFRYPTRSIRRVHMYHHGKAIDEIDQGITYFIVQINQGLHVLVHENVLRK